MERRYRWVAYGGALRGNADGLEARLVKAVDADIKWRFGRMSLLEVSERQDQCAVHHGRIGFLGRVRRERSGVCRGVRWPGMEIGSVTGDSRTRAGCVGGLVVSIRIVA